VTGTNSIVASKLGGGTLALGTYPLINYTGAFNGGLTNFTVTVVGVTGTLTNPPNQIALIITPASRGATNLTWVGDGGANNWDDNLTANWVNGLNPFKFQAGDSVTFDATGAANSTVTLNSAILQPASVLVNAAATYTFTGIGSISGSGGLTKNNSGTLIVHTTNNYTGPTVVNGGVLEIAAIANGNASSPIGASSSNPTNLVFNSASLRFTDTGSSDRGITLNGTGANVEITSGNLTLSGSPPIPAAPC
jgi:autotransporter-associated beta strand protein